MAEKYAYGFAFRPSPSLMLFACLAFGCCVSSFSHRRQSSDQFQYAVYAIILGAAAIAGCGARASVHMILLGYFPWATCAAMAVSSMAHSLYRRLRPCTGTLREDEEKAQLLVG